jgi:hypothetical protein
VGIRGRPGEPGLGPTRPPKALEMRNLGTTDRPCGVPPGLRVCPRPVWRNFRGSCIGVRTIPGDNYQHLLFAHCGEVRQGRIFMVTSCLGATRSAGPRGVWGWALRFPAALVAYCWRFRCPCGVVGGPSPVMPAHGAAPLHLSVPGIPLRRSPLRRSPLRTSKSSAPSGR